MTPKQLIFVNRLLQRQGLSFAISDYALVYSNGRTTNLASLTHKETQALISEFTDPSPQSKMKRKILSMAHEMRWETQEGKVDIPRLDAWCKKYTPSHCDFNSIPLKDLSIAVSIYEKMYNEFLKRL
jgi:hypothetical protein